MFDRIVDFSLRNKGAVLFLTLVVAVLGYLSFRDLTIEAFPDPTDTQVNVITLFPGQPTEEVERQIGLPIERALNGTPGVARLRNLSLFGLSFVTLTFHDGVDALFARQQVLERLRDAELPEGITPELGPLATPIGEIYRYTVAGAGDDPMKLRALQDWVVRPEIKRVLGVADVVSYGGLVREIHVRPDTFRLASHGLTLADLETAIAEGSVNASGGILERGAEQFVIRSEGLFADLNDLRLCRVATYQGTPVFLKDVAEVVEGWAPRQGVVSRGPKSDAVEGIVLMRRGENPSAVLERLRAAIAKINQRLAADDAEISPFYDRTDLVQSTLRTVGRNLLEGALLVVLVLFAFLLDLRAALIVATLIPLSLLTSFIYLKTRGMSANLLSMGAVDFGIIVDGAVVIVESILHRLSHPEHHAGHDAGSNIAVATKRVLRPTIFSLLIIIAAYLPIFMLERVEGRTFSPMSNTVVAALAGALFFSVTLIPVLAALVYRRPQRHRESPLLSLADRAYTPTLTFALRRPLATLGAAAGLLGLAVLLFLRLGSEFLPELNEGGLYLTFTLPANISLSEGRRLVPRLTTLWSSHPAVDEVASQLGRPEDGTDATLTSNLEFFLRLRPQDRWPPSVSSLSQVIDDLKRKVDGVPGLEVNFSQPIRDNVNENISGQFGQIAVKLYGENLDDLSERANAVKNVIAKVPGVADLGIVKSGALPQIRVTPNRAELARYGMGMGEFQHVFQTAIGGRPVSTLWEGERRFDVVMRLSIADRDDIEKIRKLRIPVDGGGTVPLEALAKVDTGFGRASISRENGRRYIGVRMNVRSRDLGSFVEEARARVQQEAPLKKGMTIEWGGEFESKERAMKRLLTVVPIALLITLMLLFKAFNSFPLAVLTLLTVPFGLMGGVFGLHFARMPLSVAAAVGFIALIGQAALNGVLVVSAIHERMLRGQPLEEAVTKGCRERLRPVLMTALLAALGLVPAALSRSMGAETQRPIAVVIVTGTLTACLLALVVLPVVYSLWTRKAPPALALEDPLTSDADGKLP
jgi:heavy metal efflux system protein